MNIARNLERSASFFPQRPVTSEGRSVTTYAQLNEQGNRIAAALMKLGVTPENHVGLRAPNSGEWLAFYFGIIKAGAVAVTLSNVLTDDELDLLIKDSVPKVILTYENKHDADKETVTGENR